jgi:hypothetical protein
MNYNYDVTLTNNHSATIAGINLITLFSVVDTPETLVVLEPEASLSFKARCYDAQAVGNVRNFCTNAGIPFGPTGLTLDLDFFPGVEE